MESILVQISLDLLLEVMEHQDQLQEDILQAVEVLLVMAVVFLVVVLLVQPH